MESHHGKQSPLTLWRLSKSPKMHRPHLGNGQRHSGGCLEEMPTNRNEVIKALARRPQSGRYISVSAISESLKRPIFTSGLSRSYEDLEIRSSRDSQSPTARFSKEKVSEVHTEAIHIS